MPQQIIQDRYIDARQLQNLLARNFSPGTYTMTVGYHLGPSVHSDLDRSGNSTGGSSQPLGH